MHKCTVSGGTCDVIQSNVFPTNCCVREAHYFFCTAAVEEMRCRARSLEGTLHGSPVFKVARRAVW